MESVAGGYTDGYSGFESKTGGCKLKVLDDIDACPGEGTLTSSRRPPGDARGFCSRRPRQPCAAITTMMSVTLKASKKKQDLQGTIMWSTHLLLLNEAVQVVAA
jgi:hypothetical protein